MGDPELDPTIVNRLAAIIKGKGSSNHDARVILREAAGLIEHSRKCALVGGSQKGGTLFDKCVTVASSSMIAETVYLLSKRKYNSHEVAKEILLKLMILLAAHTCSVLSSKCKLTYKSIMNRYTLKNKNNVPSNAKVKYP